jgi:hypothetical protein
MRIMIDMDTVDPAEAVCAQLREGHPAVEASPTGARPNGHLRLVGELDDVTFAVEDVWGSGDWRESVRQVAAYAVTEAEVKIAKKVVEMLDLRDAGLLKRSGNDFISGLLAAYRVVTDSEVDDDVLLHSVRERAAATS